MNSEEKYWDYIHTYEYGIPRHEEEVEKATDYFDVTPSAFEETYDSYFNEERE